MKKNIYYLFISLLLAFTSLSAYAQELTDKEAIGDEKSGLVSFDFKDADVRNVLRIFSHKTGINIVASSDVQGSVTVKLNNVPWEKALKIILEMQDFAYVKDGNVIKVLTKDRIAQEPLKTEVMPLDYAKASQVMATIQPMLTDRGTMQIDERANLLIVTDIPANFAPISKVVKRLDTPTQQVMIETKLIETTLDLDRKFGVKWGFLNDFSLDFVPSARSKSVSESTSNTYTLTNNANNGTLDESWDHLYDTGDARYTTGVDEDAAVKAGYYNTRQELPTYNHNDWVAQGGSFTRGFENTLDTGRTITESISKSTGSILTASSMKLVMSALIADAGTDILSSPSIVTMDNKAASINVGTDFPMPNFTYNEERGDYEVSGFTMTPIGILLTVTPHIAPNGYVTIDLHPEVSSEGTTVPMNSVNIPRINKQTLNTTIMVKDGDTVVLGGLLKQHDVYSEQRVPILHSIPVLGWLFKYKDKSIEKKNLLVFVTPTILKKENIRTISQNHVDKYTKMRDSFTETTEVYPSL